MTGSRAASKKSSGSRRGGVPAGLSEAAQDYLREIYKLQVDSDRVTTTALARRMRVSPPTTSAMVKKLASLGLVDHAPYRGVRLTPAGEQIALEVLRHHRLLELFLAETFAFGIDAVHSEADRLEHALSEELEKRIDAALGGPTHDPHGDPIPDARLRVEKAKTRPLITLATGEAAPIRSIPDRDGDLLSYLMTLAILPGKLVTLVAAAPFRGPLTISVEGQETVISAELAAQIQVAA